MLQISLEIFRCYAVPGGIFKHLLPHMRQLPHCKDEVVGPLADLTRYSNVPNALALSELPLWRVRPSVGVLHFIQMPVSPRLNNLSTDGLFAQSKGKVEEIM